MSALSPNFFSPVGFRLVSEYTPTLEYLVQKVTIPSMNLGTASTPTPFVRINNPGNLKYGGDLIVEFKLDEDNKAYDEILDWMEALGHPDNLNEQYRKTIKDIRLIMLNSSMNPIRSLLFTDTYPTFLSDIHMDTTVSDINYISCVANFSFQRMKRSEITS